MNEFYFIACILFFFYSCSSDQKKPVFSKKNENSLNETKNIVQEKGKPVLPWLNLEEISNHTFDRWIAYYKSIDSSFDIAYFRPTSEDVFLKIQGQVRGIFDPGFNQGYTPFLTYSPDNKRYLDIDSYFWRISEENAQTEIVFSVDQAIHLIDIEKKTVERIAFSGPSKIVEDTFWLNDSTIILLQFLSDEKIPSITIKSLNKNMQQLWEYSESIDTVSQYFYRRLRNKGINTK